MAKLVSVLRTAALCVLICMVVQCGSLHVKGTWRTGLNFFKFLAKFGFQKTNLKDKERTQGYIYGNITSRSNVTHIATLAVLDRGYFLEYYGNSTVSQQTQACLSMFHKINTVAYDSHCFDDGAEDFLRNVPCAKNQICPDEDKPENVVNNFQFTYVIQDLSQPRFWYMSLVACYRDLSTNCSWKPLEEDIEIEYDIFLVNGNPYAKGQNPLEYQFSFDQQDTVEIFLVVLICYMFLNPLQIYAVNRQKHPVPKLFTAGLLLALMGVFLNVVHCLKFAFDGQGVKSAAIAGGVSDILSQILFMLLLLLLAKGWAITTKELTWKPMLYSIWIVYGLVYVLLFFWDLVTFSRILINYHNYNNFFFDYNSSFLRRKSTLLTISTNTKLGQVMFLLLLSLSPFFSSFIIYIDMVAHTGWLMLILRTVVMAWFLYCLRDTMSFEHQKSKLDFFLHFGAASLVWFIYLPIVALVALQVSVLWRRKLLLGTVYSANFLAYAVMAHLLWPTR